MALGRAPAGRSRRVARTRGGATGGAAAAAGAGAASFVLLVLLAAAAIVAVTAQPVRDGLFLAPAPPSPPSAFQANKAPASTTVAPSTDPIIVTPPQDPAQPPAAATATAPPAVVTPPPATPATPPVTPPATTTPTPPATTTTTTTTPATTPAAPPADANTLTLANTLGSHMVLQQGPLPACLYGTGTPMAAIKVSLEGAAGAATQAVVDPSGNWVACLPPQKAGGPHAITVAGSGGKLALEDVWFGEVWLCSGQSNMQMSLRQALNATAELQAAATPIKGAPIRVLALGLNTSAEPLEDVAETLLPWSVASPESLGGPVWKYFSAACWFFGRNLAEGLGVPVGLVQSAYGSTELKAWTPAAALAACPPTPDAWAAPAAAAAGATQQQQQQQQQPHVPAEVAAGTKGNGSSTATPKAVPPPPPAVVQPQPPATATTTPPPPQQQQQQTPATGQQVPPAVPAVPATSPQQQPPAVAPQPPAAGAGTAGAGPTSATPTTPVDTPAVPPAPRPPTDVPVVPATVAPPAVPPAVPAAGGGGGAGGNRGLLLRRAQTAVPPEQEAAPAAGEAGAGVASPAATATATATATAKPNPKQPRVWQTDWHPEPATCYNAMVHPLRLMALKGVVWDQGEQDVHHADTDYRCLLPQFVQAWRAAFPYANALGPMPFGIFQLHGYNDDYMDITNNGTEVGRIRLAQYAGLTQPKVFLAAGYDLNDDSSPYGPVHFRDKQDVGARLAKAALANIYGEWGSLPWGPTAKDVIADWAADPKDADVQVLTVRVRFVGTGEGLVDSGVNIFELATAAEATDYATQVLEADDLALDGPETAVVSFRVPKGHALSPAAAADAGPAAVAAPPVLRYAYKNRPCPARTEETPYVGAWCGLYNSEQQPALPFIRELS